MIEHQLFLAGKPATWFSSIARRLNDLTGLQIGAPSHLAVWREQALSLAANQPAVDAACLDSLNRLRAAGKQRKKYAVVAPMPPAETGIANSTLHTFANCDGGADIFTRFETIYAYTHFACETQRAALGVDMFELAALPQALELRGYDAIVICIGNSHHNLPVAAVFASLAAFPPKIPIIVHLHDPWIPDIWAWTAAGLGRSVVSDLETVYGVKADRKRAPRQNAEDAGALGLCALIGEAPVRGVVVNSEAAETLMRRELSLAKSDIPVMRAFLPVLPPLDVTERKRTGRAGLDIATFGVPGEPKRSEDVVKAGNRLVAEGKAGGILVAGYNAANFMKTLRRNDCGNVRYVNAPSNEELERLMIEIDVAVQLRRKNRGESSGIVPQLLARGKPVVVSAVGSFVEFGDAVIQIAPDASVEDIAAAVTRAYDEREVLRARAVAYCESHTPQKFITRLDAFVGSLGA